jgi:transcriptional regulator with XRE-family HTH domain
MINAASRRIASDGTPQRVLAERMGVSRTTLNRIMEGQVWPRFEQMTNLAAAVRMRELMDVGRDEITYPD